MTFLIDSEKLKMLCSMKIIIKTRIFWLYIRKTLSMGRKKGKTLVEAKTCKENTTIKCYTKKKTCERVSSFFFFFFFKLETLDSRKITYQKL